MGWLNWKSQMVAEVENATETLIKFNGSGADEITAEIMKAMEEVGIDIIYKLCCYSYRLWRMGTISTASSTEP